MRKVLTPISVRFWSKVSKGENCWEWTGSRSGAYCHGEIGKGRRGEGKLKAHRLSWELHHGSIPNGMQVLHRCDNGMCVRPSHLFLGTQKDNMIDMIQKGRGVNQNTKKTHCIRGHELGGDNLVIKNTGSRQCRICMSRRDRQYKAKRKELLCA